MHECSLLIAIGNNAIKLKVAEGLRNIFQENGWDLGQAGMIREASKMDVVDYEQFLNMVCN